MLTVDVQELMHGAVAWGYLHRHQNQYLKEMMFLDCLLFSAFLMTH
jgi:hypothetical protein